MSSPSQVDDLLFSNTVGDEAMESEDLNLLDESSTSEHTEQGHPADESEAPMEVTPPEVAVAEATAEDLSLQEKVCEEGIKDATKEAPEAGTNDASEKVDDKGTAEEEVADVFDELVDLDNYLDTIMLDMTMVIAKAKKAGDLVAIIACPHGDHKVDL